MIVAEFIESHLMLQWVTNVDYLYTTMEKTLNQFSVTLTNFPKQSNIRLLALDFALTDE